MSNEQKQALLKEILIATADRAYQDHQLSVQDLVQELSEKLKKIMK